MKPTRVVMILLAYSGQSSGLQLSNQIPPRAGLMNDWALAYTNTNCVGAINVAYPYDKYPNGAGFTDEKVCVGVVEEKRKENYCGDFAIYLKTFKWCSCSKPCDKCAERNPWDNLDVYKAKTTNEFQKTCTVVEDPHINVFDGAQVSLLASAAVSKDANDLSHSNKWLVKSRSVSIQARFMADEGLREQNDFVRAVAIGGPFLEGNIITIGSLEDPIMINGETILNHDAESDFFQFQGKNMSIEITQRNDSSNVADLSKPNRGIEVVLPMGVSLLVNRLHHHLNIAIKMAQQEGGQEGLCGNFNGEAYDDTLELASRRFDPNVPDEESFFAGLSFA